MASATPNASRTPQSEWHQPKLHHDSSPPTSPHPPVPSSSLFQPNSLHLLQLNTPDPRQLYRKHDHRPPPRKPPPSPPTPTKLTSSHPPQVNILVPPGTLPLANLFYGTTLLLTSTPVPAAQTNTLAWFNIASSGQQLHVAFGRDPEDFTPTARKARRHPCFRVGSVEELRGLRM